MRHRLFLKKIISVLPAQLNLYDQNFIVEIILYLLEKMHLEEPEREISTGLHKQVVTGSSSEGKNL